MASSATSAVTTSPRAVSSSPVPRPPLKKQKLDKVPKQKKGRRFPPPEDDVDLADIHRFIGSDAVSSLKASQSEWRAPVELGEVLEVDVREIGSHGDGIAAVPYDNLQWALLIRFALPGERVRVRVVRNEYMHSIARLEQVLDPNPALRDQNRVKCRYFGTCGGCQYQMLDYAFQLELKQKVIEKAYQNFSHLPTELVPSVGSTFPSPLQYGYRTKITPHFDVPISRRKQKDDLVVSKTLNIGFNMQNSRTVLDIEECPIATKVLNNALGPVRNEIKRKANTYKKGATLIFRDSLNRDGIDPKATSLDLTQEHVCVTDHKGIIRECVDGNIFEFPANDFFQNNNAILKSLINYTREAIFSHCGHPSTPTHFVDTYCGSGLFAISLASHFERVAGVEISATSISYAKRNAKLNGILDGKCEFREGKAENIFETVQDFPPSGTVVLIDPPRKGCDITFIEQLLTFEPSMLVYVSCNVHTQARDVGLILKRSLAKGRPYTFKSLVGFDLFPQTAHVESIAVLMLERNV